MTVLIKNKPLRISKIIFAIFFLGMALDALAQAVPIVKKPFSDEPKSLLLIGNSFMYYNNSMHRPLLGIHNSIHEENIKTRVFYINGSSLSWHDVESYVTNENIGAFRFNNEDKIVPYADRSYDIAIMQDCSLCPIHPELSSDFRKYVKEHSKTLRNYSIEPALMMTWAYKNEPSMIEAISTEYTTVGNENNLLVIPAGLAFSRTIQEYPEIELYSDNRHPSPEGTYLAAATIYVSVFQSSPAGNPYKYGLDKKTREILQRIAWETFLDYY